MNDDEVVLTFPNATDVCTKDCTAVAATPVALKAAVAVALKQLRVKLPDRAPRAVGET